MGIAEMGGLFTFTDHDFAYSLVQKVVLICSPPRLCHIIRNLPGYLVLPPTALGMLNSLLSSVKVQLEENTNADHCVIHKNGRIQYLHAHRQVAQGIGTRSPAGQGVAPLFIGLPGDLPLMRVGVARREGTAKPVANDYLQANHSILGE